MKKILLLLVLTFITHLTFSQVKVYPKVGMVVSSHSLHFGDDVDRTDKEVKNKIGILTGVGLDASMNRRLSISTGIHYAQLGYIDYEQTNVTSTEEKYALNYINIPVALKFNLLQKGASLYTTVGAYSGMFIAGKHTTESKRSTETPDHYFYEDQIAINDRHQMDRFDWGLNMGCGLEFSFLKSNFIVDANYAIGLSNVQESYEDGIMRLGSSRWYYDTGVFCANGKNRYFSLSLGYILPFTKTAN